MTDGIEAVTRSALSMALDAASLRQQVIASNIANAGTPDHVAQRVSFEAQLADARLAIARHGGLQAAELAQWSPRIEPAVDSVGLPMPVRLDVEAAEMARNAVHYQALVKGLQREFAILSMAVADGRK